MDKSSLKSSNIECRFPHSVSRKGKLNHHAHAFMNGQFLPVSIFVGLHVIEARVGADNLVHSFVCSTGKLVLQPTFATCKPLISGPLRDDANLTLYERSA